MARSSNARGLFRISAAGKPYMEDTWLAASMRDASFAMFVDERLLKETDQR